MLQNSENSVCFSDLQAHTCAPTNFRITHTYLHEKKNINTHILYSHGV